MTDQIAGLENAKDLENDEPRRRGGEGGGGGKCRTYKNDGTNRRADNARPVTG